VDWPYAVSLVVGLLLVGVATWLVYRLGRSEHDPRADGERGYEAQVEAGPDNEVNGAG
jgi:hypothetical protein